ncbi:MAG TPA: hypothetical protein VGO00_10835 [Kofleriaceae bacterium]|jgi:hypothetical protein|nr:hypothetical protein [Kofleriaceae bacterium]
MLSALLAIWTKVDLALRLTATVPTLTFAAALDDASAAVDAATPAISADLLVSVAFIESRFDPTATSRVEGDRRRTGPYKSRLAPAGLKGSLYCGELQTYASNWADCLAMRDRAVGYAVAVIELTHWLHDRRVRGDVARALAGHGCGNTGVTTGRCHAYPSRVLAVRALLARPRVHRAPARRVT